MSRHWSMPENMCDMASLQPCMLLFGVDERPWEQGQSSFTEVGSGRSGGSHWWLSGVVIVGRCGWCERRCAGSGWAMFTCVVTATAGSVLSKECFQM